VLEARIAAAAERAGKTAHAFILEAIAEKADETERRSAFHDSDQKRYAAVVATGRAIPWSEMRACLEDRLAGKRARRPLARKPAR
jgi:dsRNA-specific ribonuclease